MHTDVLKYEHHELLTIIDAFSKYAQVYYLEISQAIEMMEILLTFFSHHSTPTIILSNNDPEFDNRIISEFFYIR